MKKLFSLLLALCLLCGAVALAEAPVVAPSTDERSTQLELSVDETYVVTIAPTLTIAYGDLSTDLPVECTKIRLLADHLLCVKANATGGKLINADNGNAEIIFTLTGDSALTGKAAHHFTATGTKSFAVEIAQAQWDAAAAGRYTGSVTFTVSIEDKN